MDFNGKVVLITGASAGIGTSCALHFANLSAKLSLTGRNVENLKKVAEQCEQVNGIQPLIITADINIEDDVARIIKETINHYGRLDVLVNNAGILIMAGIMEDVKNFDRLAATNIRGPYQMTQHAIPHLIKAKGNIVNISSILSTTPMPTMAAYCMTKAALDMYTKCAALEFAAKGVRVNSVNPGAVRTEFFERAGYSEEGNKNFFMSVQSAMPLKKVALSEDVAKMVVFLASDNAKCITGSCHKVDCGMHLGDPIVSK